MDCFSLVFVSHSLRHLDEKHPIAGCFFFAFALALIYIKQRVTLQYLVLYPVLMQSTFKRFSAAIQFFRACRWAYRF